MPISSIARLLALRIDLVSRTMTYAASGATSSETSSSFQQMMAAPMRQTSIFSGSRIIRPHSTLTPLKAQFTSLLMRCIDVAGVALAKMGHLHLQRLAEHLVPQVEHGQLRQPLDQHQVADQHRVLDQRGEDEKAEKQGQRGERCRWAR